MTPSPRAYWACQLAGWGLYVGITVSEDLVDQPLAARTIVEPVILWGGRELLMSRSLAALERQLDTRVFVRANRGEVVNLDFVERVVASEGGGLDVELRGGPTITVSRRQARLFRAGKS